MALVGGAARWRCWGDFGLPSSLMAIKSRRVSVSPLKILAVQKCNERRR